MNIKFKGKTVIVTGGARGIGASVSVMFAKAGANVMINYLPIKKDIEGLAKVKRSINDSDGLFKTFAGDISSPKDVEKLFNETVKRLGRIDIVVNCAGYTIPKKINEITMDLWKRGIEVNLSGAFYVSYFASKYMLQNRYGKIIFIGSAGSITGGGGSVAYSSAKAGVNGLVRSLSKELAPFGITVNAVLPALIDTDLLKEKEPDPKKRKEYIKRIPVGRFGRPEDVAYLVLFLASDYASYITGQNIIIDGGSTFK